MFQEKQEKKTLKCCGVRKKSLISHWELYECIEILFNFSFNTSYKKHYKSLCVRKRQSSKLKKLLRHFITFDGFIFLFCWDFNKKKECSLDKII